MSKIKLLFCREQYDFKINSDSNGDHGLKVIEGFGNQTLFTLMKMNYLPVFVNGCCAISVFARGIITKANLGLALTPRYTRRAFTPEVVQEIHTRGTFAARAPLAIVDILPAVITFVDSRMRDKKANTFQLIGNKKLNLFIIL